MYPEALRITHKLFAAFACVPQRLSRKKLTVDCKIRHDETFGMTVEAFMRDQINCGAALVGEAVWLRLMVWRLTS